MKYTVFTIIFLSFILYSCGSDNDTIYTIPDPKPQPKKVINHLSIKEIVGLDSQFNPIYETHTYEFSYENGQVSKLTNVEKDSYSSFEYDKDEKLTKISNYSNNTLKSIMDLYYSGTLLSYSTTMENGVVTQRNEYNYTQNLLTLKKSCSDPQSCTNPDLVQYTYYPNNNLESITDSQTKSVYLYDTKVNPFKDYNPYFKIFTHNFLYLTLSHNNPVSEDIYSIPSSVADRTIIYDITYDSENYPLIITGRDAVTNRLWSSYTFDYETIMITPKQ